MKSLFAARRLLILLLATLAAGTILWPIAYSDVALTTRSFLITWLAASLVAGLIGQLLLRESVAIAATLVALGYCSAVVIRVVFESIPDPTSHNLWPLEVAIAAGVGFIGGLAGATLGSLPGRSIADS